MLPRGRIQRTGATSNMGSSENRLRSIMSDDHRRENVRETIWRVYFAALVEVRVTRGVRTMDIGIEEMVVGPNDERMSFTDGTVNFIGNERTFIHMVIRLPTGAIRVVWENNAIHIDDRYRLSAEGFTAWPQPENVHARRAPVLYIELFGRRATRITIEHSEIEYMIRCEPDFPAIVMEMEQYMQLALSLLRDFELDVRDRRQSRTRRQLRRLRRRIPERSRSRTPLSPGANSNRSNCSCMNCAARTDSE